MATKPIPPDFDHRALRYFNSDLAGHYGVDRKTVRRWRRDSGIGKPVHAVKRTSSSWWKAAQEARKSVPEPPPHLSDTDRALLYAALRAFSPGRIHEVA